MTDVTMINLKILRLLGEGDSKTPSQIIVKLPEHSKKDIKYSIRRLREKGLIKVIPNLLDMRRVFYQLSEPTEVSFEGVKVKQEGLSLFMELSNSTITPNATLKDMQTAANV